jgi:3'(2'), 5'-bisphosphate nucleotidase
VTAPAIAPDGSQRAHRLQALLQPVEALARHAGEAIMEVYRTDFDTRRKDDGSPVTLADERAEALIVPALQRLLPDVPVVAEEAASRGDVPAPQALAAGRFWLVDPLDGTREFLLRNGEFTVNIALVERGEPVLGVVLAPALGPQGRLYSGVPGLGAWLQDEEGRRALQCRAMPDAGAVLAVSRAHGDDCATAAWLARWRAATGAAAPQGRLAAGSALKFGLLAQGQADLYPRAGRTMEWDTAAGQAVLVAAGGTVGDWDGAPLRYGKPGFENPWFVARGAG